MGQKWGHGPKWPVFLNQIPWIVLRSNNSPPPHPRHRSLPIGLPSTKHQRFLRASQGVSWRFRASHTLTHTSTKFCISSFFSLPLPCNHSLTRGYSRRFRASRDVSKVSGRNHCLCLVMVTSRHPPPQPPALPFVVVPRLKRSRAGGGSGSCFIWTPIHFPFIMDLCF